MKTIRTCDVLSYRASLPVFMLILLSTVVPTFSQVPKMKDVFCTDNRGNRIPCDQSPIPKPGRNVVRETGNPTSMGGRPKWVSEAIAVKMPGKGIIVLSTGLRLRGTPKLTYRGTKIRDRRLGGFVDYIETGSRDSVEIEFEDHILRIGPNTRIRLDSYVDKRSQENYYVQLALDILNGKIRITPFGLRRYKFRVRCCGATVAVRGTDFEIRKDRVGGYTMTLLEGAIDIFDERSKKLVQLDGNGRYNIKGGSPAAPAPPPRKTVTITGLSATARPLSTSSQYRRNNSYKKDTLSKIYLNTRVENSEYGVRNQTVRITCAVDFLGRVFFPTTSRTFTLRSNKRTDGWWFDISRRDGGKFSTGTYNVRCRVNGQPWQWATFTVFK